MSIALILALTASQPTTLCDMTTPPALGALMATGRSETHDWWAQQLPVNYTMGTKTTARREVLAAFTARYGAPVTSRTGGTSVAIWNEKITFRPQLPCDGVRELTMTDYRGKTTIYLERHVNPILDGGGIPRN